MKCLTCNGVGLVIDDGSNYPWQFTFDMPLDKMAIVLRNDLSADAMPCPDCNKFDQV